MYLSLAFLIPPQIYLKKSKLIHLPVGGISRGQEVKPGSWEGVYRTHLARIKVSMWKTDQISNEFVWFKWKFVSSCRIGWKSPGWSSN